MEGSSSTTRTRSGVPSGRVSCARDPAAVAGLDVMSRTLLPLPLGFLCASDELRVSSPAGCTPTDEALQRSRTGPERTVGSWPRAGPHGSEADMTNGRSMRRLGGAAGLIGAGAIAGGILAGTLSASAAD